MLGSAGIITNTLLGDAGSDSFYIDRTLSGGSIGGGAGNDGAFAVVIDRYKC